MTDSTLRYTNIKKENFLYKLGITKRPQQMACDYRGDGLGVKGKSVSFMAEKKFSDAWENLTKEIAVFSGQSVPDVRWRGHIALWAASHALQHEGDFVECGVFTGILSGLICRYFDFEKIDRSFWLFDTWDGIPVENLQGADLDIAKKYNKDYQRRDVFTGVKQAFSKYDNCHLIRGFLPASLQDAQIEKIAYLSIDLNNAAYEKACIEVLWPKLTPGAVVLLDDYNFSSCHPQQKMWDAFAAEKKLMIAALPTGQGVLIKP